MRLLLPVKDLVSRNSNGSQSATWDVNYTVLTYLFIRAGI